MLKKALIAAGAAVLLSPVAAVAQSASSDDLTVMGDRDTRSIVVSLRDLDLRRDKDVRKADSRVRTAAAKVCGVGRMNGSGIAPQYDGCYNEAFNNARVDLNSVIADARA